MRERNDCHGDEAWNAAVDRKPERDPDDESPDFYAELEKDLSAQRRNEIARPSIEYVESIKREQFDIASAEGFKAAFGKVVR